ncbi:MAG: isochorismate synthase [Cyanobacteria bacterium J06629_19]
MRGAFTFLAEAAYRIFSPHDDAYPETGVQPYSGYITR